MFLKSIYESPSYFPEFKLSSKNYYREVSTRIDLLKRKYIEFCIKEGYQPKQIDEEKELLKEFNLELDLKADSTTNAYVNIRWKTISEKLSTNQDSKFIDGSDHSDKNFNPIVKSLETECIVTSHKSDFILVSDLLVKYDKFCRERNIPDISKLKFEESIEIIEYGAEFIQNFPLPFVRGIKLTKIYGLAQSKDKSTNVFLPDVVRIPRKDKKRQGFSAWFKNK